MSKKKKRLPLRVRIKNSWELHESNDPDISTERLISMVADDCGVDYGTVAENLADLWDEEKALVADAQREMGLSEYDDPEIGFK